MKIKEILQNMNEVEIFSQKNGFISAGVSRENLAKVATVLFDEYNLFLTTLFASDERKSNGYFQVHVVFSDCKNRERLMLSAKIPTTDLRYKSLTATIMAAHWYERYLHDMFGIMPEGHPDLRRLVHHENVPEGIFPLRKDFAWNSDFPKANIEYPMLHVKGEEVFEIPVGPIHAGIIEPGHFRFNVVGERILTLEGKLFFTHKGVEKILEGKTMEKSLPFIERISGDAAASHALAFVQAVESISGCQISKRALMLRSLICELERITMHVHDLANIGGMGTGYSFIAANGFRIKERLVRLSEDIFKNRFWRGYIVLGGVLNDLDQLQLEKIASVANQAWREIKEITDTALASEGFLDRLQSTGILSPEAALAFGAVGIPARSSGIDYDVRKDFPYAAYGEFPIKTVIKKSKDVFARYRLRILEIEQSVNYVQELVKNIPEGSVKNVCNIRDGFAIETVESWRGEIACALNIKNGVVERCFPRDPSFCNWALFAIMGPGNIVPDFPLINKSLNLSYSGTDL